MASKGGKRRVLPKNSPSSPAEALEEGEYIVNRIKNRKTVKGKYLYLVEWKGYIGEDTWEPKKNLYKVLDMVEEMDKKMDKEEKKRKKRSSKTPGKSVGYANVKKKRTTGSVGGKFSEQPHLVRSSRGRSPTNELPSTRKRPLSDDRSPTKDGSASEESPPPAKTKRGGEDHDAVRAKKSTDSVSTIKKSQSAGVSSVTTADLELRAEDQTKGNGENSKASADAAASEVSGDLTGDDDQKIEYGGGSSFKVADATVVGDTTTPSTISKVVDAVASGNTEKKPDADDKSAKLISSDLSSQRKSVGSESSDNLLDRSVRLPSSKHPANKDQLPSRERPPAATKKRDGQKHGQSSQDNAVSSKSVPHRKSVVSKNGSSSTLKLPEKTFEKKRYSAYGTSDGGANTTLKKKQSFYEISDFYYAIERLDVPAFKRLLDQQGPKCLGELSKSASDYSLLMFAARHEDNESHGLCEILDALMSSCQAIDYQNGDGETVLLRLCKYGSPCCVIKLLQHHPRLDLVDKNGETALFAAVKRNSLPMVRALLSQGASVSIKNKDNKHIMNYVGENMDELKEVHELVENVIKTMTGVFYNAIDMEIQKQKPLQKGETVTRFELKKPVIELTWFSTCDRKNAVEIPFRINKAEAEKIKGALLFLCFAGIAPVDEKENDQCVIKATFKDNGRLKTLIRKVVMNGKDLSNMGKAQGDKMTFIMGQSFYEKNVLEIQFNEPFLPGEVLLVRANGFQLKVQNVPKNDGDHAIEEKATQAASAGVPQNVTEAAGSDAQDSAMDVADSGGQTNVPDVAGSAAQDNKTQAVRSGAQGNVTRGGLFELPEHILEVEGD